MKLRFVPQKVLPIFRFFPAKRVTWLFKLWRFLTVQMLLLCAQSAPAVLRRDRRCFCSDVPVFSSGLHLGSEPFMGLVLAGAVVAKEEYSKVTKAAGPPHLLQKTEKWLIYRRTSKSQKS